MQPVLTDVQLWASMAIASTIVWVVKQLAERYTKWAPTTAQLSWLVYGASYLMAFLFGGYTFPAFAAWATPPEFMASLSKFITDVLGVIGSIAGMAYLFYNVIWQKVLEGIKTKIGERKQSSIPG